ncbi:MAG: hypothetical protein KGL39_60200 [Patescibacteria group bacterium]|nr:hypothetical protein [Patescibacteria group bacterium]
MPVPTNRHRGPRPEKFMRDALMLELNTEVHDPKLPRAHRRGQKDHNLIKRLRLVARALVNSAIDGDVAAIKEINDRIDGKIPHPVKMGGDENAPPIAVKSLQDLTDAQLDVLAERLTASLGKDGK